MPDVFERRPDVSAAVASVVDRATAKDPQDRYDSVAEMVRDLEATLEVEAARGGGTSGEATTVLRSVPRSQRRLGGGGVSRAGVAMGVVGIGLIAAAVLFGGDQLDKLGDGASSGSEVKLVDASDFDPSSTGGDDEEHSDEVGNTIDGDPTGTAWSSETYSLADYGNKPGVGLVVEAGEPVEATALELRMAVGGADIEVYAAPGAGDPPADLASWSLVGEQSDVGARAKIDLRTPSPSAVYLVWITKLPEADDGSGFRAEIVDIRLID
jgi:serine/threonine-protein kinase